MLRVHEDSIPMLRGWRNEEAQSQMGFLFREYLRHFVSAHARRHILRFSGAPIQGFLHFTSDSLMPTISTL